MTLIAMYYSAQKNVTVQLILYIKGVFDTAYFTVKNLWVCNMFCNASQLKNLNFGGVIS